MSKKKNTDPKQPADAVAKKVSDEVTEKIAEHGGYERQPPLQEKLDAIDLEKEVWTKKAKACKDRTSDEYRQAIATILDLTDISTKLRNNEPVMLNPPTQKEMRRSQRNYAYEELLKKGKDAVTAAIESGKTNPVSFPDTHESVGENLPDKTKPSQLKHPPAVREKGSTPEESEELPARFDENGNPLEMERLAKEFKKKAWDTPFTAALESITKLRMENGEDSSEQGILEILYYGQSLGLKEKLLKTPKDKAEVINALLANKLIEYEMFAQVEMLNILRRGDAISRDGDSYDKYLEKKIMIDNQLYRIIELMDRLGKLPVKIQNQQINLASLQQTNINGITENKEGPKIISTSETEDD